MMPVIDVVIVLVLGALAWRFLPPVARRLWDLVMRHQERYYRIEDAYDLDNLVEALTTERGRDFGHKVYERLKAHFEK